MTPLVAAIPDELTEARMVLVQQAKEHKIVDQDTYEMAVNGHRQAALLEKRITDHYEPMRETTKAAYDAVLEAKRHDLDPVLEVKRILSRSIASFEIEQERERQREQARRDREALDKAEAERKKDVVEAKKSGASKQELEEIKKAPVTAVSPEVPPTFERSNNVSKPIERWSAELLEPDGFMLLLKAVVAGAIPINAVLPNQSWLDGMARVNKSNLKIPGVKAVCDYTASTRFPNRGR